MMIKYLSIGGTSYMVKYPIGALIKAEHKIGKKLSDIIKNMSIEDTVTLVRYGLHNSTTGQPLTDVEFEDIINNVDTAEFMQAVPEILSALSGGAQAKN